MVASETPIERAYIQWTGTLPGDAALAGNLLRVEDVFAAGFEAGLVHANATASSERVKALEALNDGYVSRNRQLIGQMGEAERIIAFLLKITGPVTIPDVDMISGQRIEIIAMRDLLHDGKTFSVKETP